MAYKPDLTDEQRANLTKLAVYLKTLPAEYPDFEMSSFTKGARGSGSHYAHVPVCGTAACAAGHGPTAGVKPLDRETWGDYSRRAFARDAEAWDWCFGSAWCETDNTVHGAAARIETMLAAGIPCNAEEQRWGDEPLSYTVPA